MAAIVLVPHTDRPEAVELAETTALRLERAGHHARVLLSELGTDEPERDDSTTLDRVGADLHGLDLAVSLGGDGTMLRTVDLVSPAGVPVLGVNFGRLGYLTAVEPDGLDEALDRFLAGDFQIERRMTLLAEVVDGHGRRRGAPRHALNDVVLQRTNPGHTVRLSLEVSGVAFITYEADSLIVATPTGSTAYNLSARGPIVSPRARVLVVTPVAAHMLFDRSMVLAAGEDVALEVLDGRSAELVIDGTRADRLVGGDVLRCRTGNYDAQLVHFGDRDFRSILKQKFGLTDR